MPANGANPQRGCQAGACAQYVKDVLQRRDGVPALSRASQPGLLGGFAYSVSGCSIYFYREAVADDGFIDREPIVFA